VVDSAVANSGTGTGTGAGAGPATRHAAGAVIDRLDARLIEMLSAEPRIGVLESSRRLGVARGTVQARLDRLAERGVITGYGPDIDPAALGYAVTAFITLELRQAGGRDRVAEGLAKIDEILEAHTITGTGDIVCRVVARTNADLQRVVDAIVDVPGVVRTSTVIALASAVGYRTIPLVRAAARGMEEPGHASPAPGHADAGTDTGHARFASR
jgi:DNA-binding Lrp family transcriptional regulator